MDEIREAIEYHKNYKWGMTKHAKCLVDLAERVLACEGLPEKLHCLEHPQNNEAIDCMQCAAFLSRNFIIDECSIYTEKLRLELEQSKNRERMCGDYSVKRELEFVTLREQMKGMAKENEELNTSLDWWGALVNEWKDIDGINSLADYITMLKKKLSEMVRVPTKDELRILMDELELLHYLVQNEHRAKAIRAFLTKESYS